MADDTAPIPFPDKQIDPPDHEPPAPEVETSEQAPAKERLAAAEHRLLGEDVAKQHGHPERGIGSRYAALHPAHKAHLAAIEHLIAVEAEHADAERALHAVHAKIEHAMARVDATEETSNAELSKEAEHG